MAGTEAASFESVVREKIGVIVHGADHHIYLFANEMFAAAGVTFQQAVAINFIHFHKGCNQKALETFMKTRSASVTVLLSTLIGKELVQKRPNPVDARSILLSLTPKGKRTAVKCREILRRLDVTLRTGMTEEEVAVLKDLLRRLMENCIRSSVSQSGSAAPAAE